ncbi:hydrogenase assembly chaperone HypC/HupF [Catenulispora sp. GAS73]|uniref:HypC/HybG/HupF family hydrogenase formation chaperone n=1 Tax=Catenulispora sp. GAS73 TaxID=3156269 RepID=UPI003514E45C
MSAGRVDDGAADLTACSTDGECITCGDVAVPLTVVSVAGSDARCRDKDGREESVALEFVGPVDVGDRVLVHAGVAIELLPAAPAEFAEPAEPAEPVSEV